MSNSAELWSEALMNTYGTPALEIVDGHGTRLVGADGREYLDLLAGIAVNSLGYGHPRIVEAVADQVRRFSHVSNLFISRPVVRVAEELCRRVETDQPVKAFFCNSGAEANEAAFKLARLTGRRRILAAQHGFHGRTMGSLALTGQPDKRSAFQPLPAGVEFYPFGDIDYLRKLVNIDASNVAAIFLEPIQGETGVIPALEGFLTDVRALCDEHGILMVTDEVQTGVGRTGTFFAFQHDGIVPDIITMAKGLAGGLPIGACLAVGEATRLFSPGSHGTTFGGNPVACAAASAVLETVDEALCASVRVKGETLMQRLSQVPGVDFVRGRGLMIGVVLEQQVAKEVVKAGFHHGVILNAPDASVIRLTPPLILSNDDIDEAVDAIAAAVADALAAASQSDSHKGR